MAKAPLLNLGGCTVVGDKSAIICAGGSDYADQ